MSVGKSFCLNYWLLPPFTSISPTGCRSAVSGSPSQPASCFQWIKSTWVLSSEQFHQTYVPAASGLALWWCGSGSSAPLVCVCTESVPGDRLRCVPSAPPGIRTSSTFVLGKVNAKRKEICGKETFMRSQTSTFTLALLLLSSWSGEHCPRSKKNILTGFYIHGFRDLGLLLSKWSQIWKKDKLN